MGERKLKVLYFVDRMRHGGIQTMAVEMARNLSNNVEIEYIVLNDGETYPLEEEIKKCGKKLYKIEAWLRTPLDYINYYKKMDMFFKEHHDYDVIHINTGSKNFPILKLAQKYGIPKRIAHSHNTGFQTKNKIEELAGNLFKPFLRKYATDFFACSKEAGEWLFGKKLTKQGKVVIIKNAIDYNKFKFNEAVRNQIRKEYNLESKLVIGNIGRFTKQKNHESIVEIFNEIYKENKNSVLLLIGTGEKENEVTQKVKEYNIEKAVKFLGYKQNANEFFNAMDVFIMPSLYEGLPLVAIEAQANGLKCFLSKNVISDDVKIGKGLTFLDLEKSPNEWAKTILKSDCQRENTYENFKEKGYFIEDLCSELVNLYKGE